MSLPVKVEIPGRDAFVDQTVSEAFQLKDDNYEILKYEFGFNVFDEDLDNAFDSLESGLSNEEGPSMKIQGVYQGLPRSSSGAVELPNPEPDFEEMDEEDYENHKEVSKAYKNLIDSGKNIFDSKHVRGVPVRFPDRDRYIDLLRQAEEAVEEYGFDVANKRLFGSGSSDKSALEAFEDFEDNNNAVIGLNLETPFVEGRGPVIISHIDYTDNGSEGYFRVRTEENYNPSKDEAIEVPDIEDWDSKIEEALESAGFTAERE